jgi:hypothetical protein
MSYLIRDTVGRLKKMVAPMIGWAIKVAICEYICAPRELPLS